MRGGVLLLLIGIVMAYLAVSGKYRCFTVFTKCVTGDGNCDCNTSTTQNVSLKTNTTQPTFSISLPKLPPLPSSGIPIIYG